MTKTGAIHVFTGPRATARRLINISLSITRRPYSLERELISFGAAGTLKKKKKVKTVWSAISLNDVVLKSRREIERNYLCWALILHF